MKHFKFGALLLLIVLQWALMSLGVAAAAFLLVGPCHGTEFGVNFARFLIGSWVLVLTPLYFWKAIKLARNSSES
jgi:uncharacterized membrane protein